jgi:hypothetical protein
MVRQYGVLVIISLPPRLSIVKRRPGWRSAIRPTAGNASVAPRAEVTVYPWRAPKDLLAKTVNQVREFLRAHQPVTSAR